MTDTIIYTVREKEKLFTDLYMKAFPATAKYIRKMGGSLEEAKDVFQDALVIYYEKTHLSSESLIQNKKAYILGIARHLWNKKFKQNAYWVALQANTREPTTEAPASPSINRLLHFLESAGEKCMRLLHSFYYEKLPAEEIVEKYGYSGVRSATVQKFKCLEKIRNCVKEKSLGYEDFLE